MPAEVHRLPLPPHSIEAEQAVLGAVMFDHGAWTRIDSRITSADFYRNSHQQIFTAISHLRSEGKDADPVTVNEHLERIGKAKDCSGLAYLVALTRDTPSSANVETYAAVVAERAALRRLNKLAAHITHLVTDGTGASSADIIADIEALLLKIRSRARVGTGLVSARELVGELIDDLERRRAGPIGLRIGLSDFDELSSGLEPGDLVVMAGRPGMGKTAWLVSTASATSTQTDVAVFSAEMSSQQLMRRAISLLSNVSQGLLRRADQLDSVHWDAIGQVTGTLAARRLHIDDTPSPALSHIRAECMALKARASLGLVMVDYIQLVKGEGENRYQELREVAYGMKNLAKELAVPVILLAQLNRGVESRENKRPHLSDLRDSGAIEEAADIIGLLYSEGYYNPQFSMAYVLECMFAKNRNGERGECFWRFDGAHSRVQVLDDGARAQYRQLRARTSQTKRGSGDDL